MNVDAQYFERLFLQNDDPWAMRSRWYERRKRAMTIAALPDARYAHALELGCANGELAAELATHCERLVAVDRCQRAAELATSRLSRTKGGRVRCMELPEQWPEGSFDLFVISEIGYYLSPQRLNLLAQRCMESARSHFTVLACHFRHPIAECAWSGDDVHEHLRGALDLALLTHIRERDFVLDVWSSDDRSVAQREGLV